MSKFKAYIKDWAMAEITADLIDAKEKDALDGVRHVYIFLHGEEYDVIIPKGRAIPFKTFRKGCLLETILDYYVSRIELDCSGQLTILLYEDHL